MLYNAALNFDSIDMINSIKSMLYIKYGYQNIWLICVTLFIILSLKLENYNLWIDHYYLKSSSIFIDKSQISIVLIIVHCRQRTFTYLRILYRVSEWHSPVWWVRSIYQRIYDYHLLYHLLFLISSRFFFIRIKINFFFVFVFCFLYFVFLGYLDQTRFATYRPVMHIFIFHTCAIIHFPFDASDR